MRRHVCRQLFLAFLLLFCGLGQPVAGAQKAQQNTPDAAQVQTQEAQAPAHQDTEFYDLYKTLQSIIDDVAVDAVPSDTEFRYAAAKGFMRALKDPYSDFFTPEETTYLKEQMEGSFAGIGATLKPEGMGGFTALSVVEIIPDSPAAKAGLQINDRIVEIDGVAVGTYPYLIAIMHIRGEKNTGVKLTVIREGSDKPLTITPVREEIILPDTRVIWRLESGIGIITLPHFGDNTVTELFAAIRESLAAGATAFIVDVRNNPGGRLDAAVLIASAWATNTDQTVTTLQGKTDEKAYYAAQIPTQLALTGKKTIVLVNGSSASASEILTGTLQDWEAATVIGTTTFGKGIAQSVIPLSDGSSVHITSAYWLTPQGRRIHGKGLAPDITVEMTPEDIEAKRDPQLARAMEFLQTGQ